MNNFVGIYVVPLPSGIALILSVCEHSSFRTLLKSVSYLATGNVSELSTTMGE